MTLTKQVKQVLEDNIVRIVGSVVPRNRVWRDDIVVAQIMAELLPLLSAAEQERGRLEQENERLRKALIGLVGVSSRDELAQMEMAIRAMPAPVEDKAAMLDAIHALSGDPR